MLAKIAIFKTQNGRGQGVVKIQDGKFLPSLSVNFINYLQNVWSAMSLSLLVPEEKKLPISRKASIPCIYIRALQAPAAHFSPVSTIC